MPLTEHPTGYPFIVVSTDSAQNPTFHLTVKEALDKINSKPVGKKLLKAISKSNVSTSTARTFKVKIVRPTVTGDISKPGAEGGSRAVAFNELAAEGGGGCASACYWNPNIYSVPAPSGAGVRPAFIGLAHELIHCMHNAEGTKKHAYMDEENFTVGLESYANEAICENTVRKEHGLSARLSY
jgi:hypothetical protein